MDCGPAALKSFLEGHGISLSYGRLREACQTEVDGTSIETLEELASGLGAPVEQVLLPKDSVLLEEARALPAIAVLRLPNGSAHFAVVWSVVGGVAQVMDPAHGRRWLSAAPRRALGA
jgi:ATP-binding cassette subfamily B protein